MTASEKFKELIKAEKMTEAFALVVSEAVELKLTTFISNPDPNQASREYLITSLNLVEGEITNEITPELINHPAYQELCQFHFDQVKQGQQIIFNNLRSLQQILAFLSPSSPILSLQETHDHDSNSRI